MTKSDRIRQLWAEGLSRSEIAKKIGIRYQHVYNVLKQSSLLNSPGSSGRTSKARTISKEAKLPLPPTLISALITKGFSHLGEWKLDGADGIRLTGKAPSKPGVYAFALDDKIVYVGVSERNLRQRLYFYAKPGARQRTSIRVKALILDQLKNDHKISVSIAHLDRIKWNDMDVPMDTAVEAGLIQALRPAWNKMGL